VNRLIWEPVVRAALTEDLGRAGDVTTDAIVPVDLCATAAVVARDDGVIAGLVPSLAAFTIYDPAVEVTTSVSDGDRVVAGQRIATISGPARALLTAERTCLNVLGHLSGIATVTRAVVDAVASTAARVVDTRKTTPGLRALEKHAVRCGGGANHRFGLDDALLIKDNHIVIAGGITAAVDAARRHAGHLVALEIEVDDLDQLDEALTLPVDVVMLDNFSLDDLREASRRVRAARDRGMRIVSEASGGIRPDTAAAIAATGVDLLSMGWLTHSAPNLDVALDM